ncbi:hypothetical protein BH23ACT11_BH23ACT11_21270 [soil metagenome]
MARTAIYKELDEVRAPKPLPEVGIKAGDRGVVVLEHERPRPAVEVEYAGERGVPKAFVVYTPDLERVLAVHPEES